MARNRAKSPAVQSPPSPQVYVITCTGARPEAFALCEKYMRRQTLKDWTWIVVDDYEHATPCTMGQTVIRPEPFWPGNSVHNTLNRNMVAGLRAVGTGSEDYVIFVEDDDWYSPTYLAEQVAALSSFSDKQMVGQIPACYYHVKIGVYKVFDNRDHASLCQTAIRGTLVPALIELCESGDWIDVTFWGRKASVSHTYAGNKSVVGIKGLPGRPGVSAVHRTLGGSGWVGDPDGDTLRDWIGAEDALTYKQHRLAVSTWEMRPQGGKMEDSKNQLESFVGLGGQVRFRCPGTKEERCAFDDYSAINVMKHWQGTHAQQDNAPAVNLFDANDQPLQPTRRLIIPGGTK
jgi:hypothetical protein